MHRTLVCLLALGLASTAHAKPKEAEPKAEHMTFENEEVNGGTLYPDGSAVQSARGPRRLSLIKHRETFVPELLKSADSI